MKRIGEKQQERAKEKEAQPIELEEDWNRYNHPPYEMEMPEKYKYKKRMKNKREEEEVNKATTQRNEDGKYKQGRE